MAKKNLLYLCATLIVCSISSIPAMAVSIFSDNFESGVNSSSTWAVVTAGQSLLDGDTGGHHLGNQSAKQVNAFTNGVTDVYYMKTQTGAFTNPGPVAAGTREIATVQFWDENIRTDQSGDSAIDIKGGLMLAGDHASTDFYQIGVNSPTSVTNYFVRTQAEGLVATSVARTQGWHELRIEVYPWTGGVGDVQFYIDGANVNPAGFGKRRTLGAVDMNEIRLGLSARTPDSPFWFDNVSLDVVPEPASIGLLVIGCLAIPSCCRRLRRDRRV
jgi:hypothetical protein